MSDEVVDELVSIVTNNLLYFCFAAQTGKWENENWKVKGPANTVDTALRDRRDGVEIGLSDYKAVSIQEYQYSTFQLPIRFWFCFGFFFYINMHRKLSVYCVLVAEILFRAYLEVSREKGSARMNEGYNREKLLATPWGESILRIT